MPHFPRSTVTAASPAGWDVRGLFLQRNPQERSSANEAMQSELFGELQSMRRARGAWVMGATGSRRTVGEKEPMIN